MAAAGSSGKNRTTVVPLRGSKTIRLYAGARVSDALREISSKMTMYEGVRLTQVLEAMYEQGRKDGARKAFEELDDRIAKLKEAILANLQKKLDEQVAGGKLTKDKAAEAMKNAGAQVDKLLNTKLQTGRPTLPKKPGTSFSKS